MAGAQYEVNIVLKADEVKGKLKSLAKDINDFQRSVVNKGASAVNQSVSGLQAQGIALRRLGTQTERILRRTQKIVTKSSEMKLLPSSEMLEKRQKKSEQVIRRLDSLSTNFERRREAAQKRSQRLEEDMLIGRSRRLDREERQRRLDIARARRQTGVTATGASGFSVLPRSGRLGPAESIEALTQAQQRRAALAKRIDVLEVKGVETAKMRAKLGELTTSYGNRQFGTAKQLNTELKRQVAKAEHKLKLTNIQNRLDQQAAARRKRNANQALADERKAARIRRESQAAERGRLRATGGSEVFGPLARLGRSSMVRGANEAQMLAAYSGGRTLASPIVGSGYQAMPGVPGSAAANLAARRSAAAASQASENQIRQMVARVEQSRANAQASWTKALRDLGETAEVIRARQARVKMSWNTFFGQAEEVARDLQNTVRVRTGAAQAPATSNLYGPQLPPSLRGQASPFAGFNPRNMLTRKRAGDAALGAGFPLLFGGGPGAVIGGGLGGLSGGGLAAQIAFSAIGQQIDRFVQQMVQVGQAFNAQSFNLERVAQATGIAGTQTEKLLGNIERYGSAAEAAEYATQLLASRVGGPGAKALKKFGEDAARLGNALSTIFTQVLANIAKLAGPLLNKLASMATQTANRSAFRQAEGLTGVDKVFQELLRGGSGKGGKGNVQAKIEKLRAAGFTGEIPTGTQSFRNFVLEETARRGAALSDPIIGSIETRGTQLELENKAGKGPKSRLPRLQAQQAKLEGRLRIEKELYALRLQDDRAGIARLENQLRLSDIKAKELEITNGTMREEEKRQALRNLGLDIARSELQLQYDLAVVAQDEYQKKVTQKAEEIRLQQELNVGYQQQLKLAQQISTTLGQGLANSLDLLITGTQNWGLALRDIAANVLQDIARQLIQIYVIEQAISFMQTLMSPVKYPTDAKALENRYGEFGAQGARNAGADLPPLPKMAKGGPVSGGMPYIVGERGPELFVPGAKGNIVPNHAMSAGNIVVNVDASGSSAEGDSNQQKQLGEAIGIAIRQELIKQQRPGGLLA